MAKQRLRLAILDWPPVENVSNRENETEWREERKCAYKTEFHIEDSMYTKQISLTGLKTIHAYDETYKWKIMYIYFQKLLIWV